MRGTYDPPRLWSVILSGGEGERMQPFIRRWQGRSRPKQYCTFVGARSLFQHTVDRSDRLTAPERRVSVVAGAHRGEVEAQLEGRRPGLVVYQPANRGTAVGLFLALSHVRARDPEATVVIFPSDHFVHPEDRFLTAVRRACGAAEALETQMVLLAIPPRSSELEYGWIVPGRAISRDGDGTVRSALAFVEKPSAAGAAEAHRAGGLWNTLIVASKVEALWRAGWECLPGFMPQFESLAGAIGTAGEAEMRDALYGVMPTLDFSTDVLQAAPERIAVSVMEDVWWSDWGQPERVLQTVRRLGRPAAFSADLVHWRPRPSRHQEVTCRHP